MGSPTLRQARAADAAALAVLAEQTFRATFAASNSAEDMALHCRNAYGEAIQAAEIAHPSMATLLVEQDDRLLGYAQLRWGRAPPCVVAKSPGEIQRLYVVQEAQGRGIANELMRRCIERLAARCSDVAWLGVWERNPRAIAFYRKFDFLEVGEHVFALGSDRQRDIVMAKPLA